jgi:hypothetical protein
MAARLVLSIGKLVADHLALARLEIGEDARRIGGQLATVALFIPFVFAGYALLSGALAAVLARWLTPAGALLLVGGVNLLAGGIGLRSAIAGLRLPEKVEEIADGMKAQALTSVVGTIDSIDRSLETTDGAGR